MSRTRFLLAASLLSSSLLGLGCGPAAAPDIAVAMRWHGAWSPGAQAALRAVVEDPSRGDRLRVSELRATVVVDVYAADAEAPAHQARATHQVDARGMRITLYPEATASVFQAGVELDRQLGALDLRADRTDGPGPGLGHFDRMLGAGTTDGPGPGLDHVDRLLGAGTDGPGPGLDHVDRLLSSGTDGPTTPGPRLGVSSM